VPGNPLGANCIVRYLLNYPGSLGGQTEFDTKEMIWSFSENIALDFEKKWQKKPPVLFLPPVDPREFTFTEKKSDYQVVYAGKYRSFIGEPPEIGNLPSVEIFREGRRKQSRKEVAELLSNAKIVYVFENTSIATEAILSGTPVVFVKNKFLGHIIAERELTSFGVIESEDELQNDGLSEYVLNGRNAYLGSIEKFFSNLQEFVEQTQIHAVLIPYKSAMNLPNLKYVVNGHRIRLGIQILHNQGLVTLARVTKQFLIRRIALKNKA
jgi:hypothetical protein